MSDVTVACDKCDWTIVIKSDLIRGDQNSYMEAWQHVQTSHRDLAEWISASLSIAERKTYLIGWSHQD